MQRLIDSALCAARIGQDRSIFQMGQYFLHHRNNLQDRWAEIDNISVSDNSIQIG